ncbi:MAG: hypothetical protein IIC50_16870 [Planctomycetes bacterium]|nr:hypothetical protein [Planctomycetota bacterium]
MTDPIVAEVRRIRKEIEAEPGGDWDALERHLMESQKKRSDNLMTYSPKRLPDRGIA